MVATAPSSCWADSTMRSWWAATSEAENFSWDCASWMACSVALRANHTEKAASGQIAATTSMASRPCRLKPCRMYRPLLKAISAVVKAGVRARDVALPGRERLFLELAAQLGVIGHDG